MFRILYCGLLSVVVITSTAMADIVPNDVAGRFIRIGSNGTVDGTNFNIGEVVAFDRSHTDRALSGAGATAVTSMGNVTHGGDAALINGAYESAGSTWTRNTFRTEALIDLGSTQNLQTIFTHNRTDCCNTRLSNFDVTVQADAGGTPGATVFSDTFSGSVPQNQSAEFDLVAGNTIRPGGDGTIGVENAGRNARFIRLQNNGLTPRTLHTSEVEGFAPGVTPNNNSAPSTNDLASTFHSEHFGIGGGGSHGSTASTVDGNLETGGSTYSRNGVQNQVTIDLNTTTEVGNVRVWQRADGCCQDRLSNFTISLLTDDGTGTPGAEIASQNFAGQVTTNSFADIAFANQFTIGANDTLQIDIDLDAMAADLLTIGAAGDGNLIIEPGATLELNFTGTLFPQTFDILDFGTVSGMFDNIIINGRDPADVNLDNLLITGQIVATPEPASIAIWTLLALALGGYGYARSRRKA